MNSSNLNQAIILAFFIVLLLSISCSDDNPVTHNHPPAVIIVSPIENASYNEVDTISFTAEIIDLDNDVLSDSSYVWVSDVDGEIGVGKNFQIDYLTPKSHNIVLSVTDAKGDVGVDSITINILSNRLPRVRITNPSDTTVIQLGDTITFIGYANDFEDTALTGTSLVWSSDMDGQLGTGNEVTVNNLSENFHVISLTATDSDGNEVNSQTYVRSTTSWRKYYDNGNDGSSVIETSDGGFMTVGSTKYLGAGENDLYLLKTDFQGNKQWEKAFGGADQEWGHSVQETSDGGFVATGHIWTNSNGQGDVYLVKTDANGNLLWEKNYGGNSQDEGRSVLVESDGSLIIAGMTRSYGAGGEDCYLIKTDDTGAIIWEKTIGINHDERCYSISKTDDGGYLLSGIFSFVSTDVLLVKVDSLGEFQWEKKFEGMNWTSGNSVSETSNGDIIIVGTKTSYESGSEERDVYLIKTESNGNLLWEKTFGGSGYDDGYCIKETSDNGYIIVGTYSNDGFYVKDVYLIKTDINGNVLWERIIDNEGHDDIGFSVLELTSGGYLIAGSSFSIGLPYKVFHLRTDDSGNVY